MAARYGFGLFPLPAYREARLDDWRVARHGSAPVTGYLSGPTIEPWRHVLYQGRRPWMSTSLMEQESHAFHVARAEGVVVVAGLGLAMYAYAVAHAPAVERVVVVERSPEVIRLVAEAAGLRAWPCRDKVAIVEADARGPELAERMGAVLAGRRPHYFYADIWTSADAAAAPGETAAMVAALRPERAGWWGQELAFGRWCRSTERPPSPEALGDYAAEIGVPIPVTAGYAAFCRDVAAARLPRPAHPAWRRLRRAMKWRTGSDASSAAGPTTGTGTGVRAAPVEPNANLPSSARTSTGDPSLSTAANAETTTKMGDVENQPKKPE